MVGIAAMIPGFVTEIPEIDKVSVAGVVIGGLELRNSGIALAQKRLGRYLGILYQKVEAGRDTCLSAGAVRLYAVSVKSIERVPHRYFAGPYAVSAAGTGKLILVIVGIKAICLTLASAGIRMPMSSAMIAITTSSSTNVKPFFFIFVSFFFLRFA